MQEGKGRKPYKTFSEMKEETAKMILMEEKESSRRMEKARRLKKDIGREEIDREIDRETRRVILNGLVLGVRGA